MSAPRRTAVDQVLIALRRALGQREQAPAPMPTEPDDAARWWLAHMSAPKRQNETAGAYGRRCDYALNGWLRLAEPDRIRVVGLVRAGFPYCGESIEAYLQVVHETRQMRRLGVEAYRAQALRTAGGSRGRHVQGIAGPVCETGAAIFRTPTDAQKRDRVGE